MASRLVTLGLVLLLWGTARGILAQPADTVITEATLLATFEAARALAVDPSGKLYVVDAGRDALVQLDGTGAILSTLGGPGTEQGQFDEPADVDPANGLLWIVADAGNSRLQRFSRTFLHLESLPVARIDAFTPGVAGRTVSVGGEGQIDEANGRPIAVITNNANEIFVIEEMQSIVLKWDASRRLERAIGGYDAGEGSLIEPVALAADATSLFVADRGHAAVMVYDHFGGFIRALAPGRVDAVQAISITNETLWIVLPDRILQYGTSGLLHRVIDVDIGEFLIDVAQHGEFLFLLTSTRLLRTRL